MPGTKEKPSAEVIRYFADKKLQPSFAWQDVWGEEHAHAFTVAKSTGFDILGDVREAVQQAIENGETFETFQKSLEPKLRLKGWWGSRIVIDPKTGEKVRAKLGSARRLKVIYEANIRSARAAGQWERAQRTKGVLPYLVYCLGPSEMHRPLHAEKEHLVLPVDDTFWDEWYPPNGWGCKCYLRQIGRGEAASLGGPSTPPPVERRPYINPRTGEETMIPRGIDPGWQTSPGKARARGLTDRINERLQAEGEANVRPVIAELWQNRTAEALARVEERIRLPAGISPALRDVLGARGALITVSNDTVRKKKDKREKEGTELRLGAFANIQQMLDTGEIVDEGMENKRGVVTTILGRLWYLVIGRSANGYMFVRTLHPSSPSAMDRIRARAAKRKLSGEGS